MRVDSFPKTVSDFQRYFPTILKLDVSGILRNFFQAAWNRLERNGAERNGVEGGGEAAPRGYGGRMPPYK